MYFIYSLLLGLGFLVLIPLFLLDSFGHGKYVAGFHERLGSISPLPNDGRPVVWIHCVSGREAQAARALVAGSGEQHPNNRIVVSTTTMTGQTLAREVFKHDAAKVVYFPFDWRWVVRRSLKAIRPGAVLVMETELWPGFLRECQQQKMPVAILNGRLSEQSFRRYRLIRGFMKRVVGSLSLAIMQTEADAERLRLLGMDPAKTLVSGSLKFDAGTRTLTDSLTVELRDRFDLGEANSDRPLILAASTHEPEEVILLNSLRQVISKSGLQPRLMIAPRHPERFSEVADLIRATGLPRTKRSATPDAGDRQAGVILLDSIGELHSVYSLAAIVFVGGSLAKTRGHKVLEPAAVGVPVVVGPHTYNFQSIVETFVAANAIVQLKPLTDSAAIVELADLFTALLADPAKREELGTRARNVVVENAGATGRAPHALSPIPAA